MANGLGADTKAVRKGRILTSEDEDIGKISECRMSKPESRGKGGIVTDGCKFWISGIEEASLSRILFLRR